MLAKSVSLALGLTSLTLLLGCGSTPVVELELSSDPAGAEVYLSRRGEKSVRADMGPVEGDLSTEELVEDFVYLGTSPLEYSSPLEENESGAKLLGFGGAVVREYHEGLLRFEKPGYATVERRVMFRKGKVGVHVSLPPSVSGAVTARP